MSLKIVGRIDAVEYTEKKLISIRFIPDQEYSLTINDEKIAVFVSKDNKQCTDAKNLVYKKYLTIMCNEFTNVPVFFNALGKKIELVLTPKSACLPAVEVTISADGNSSKEEKTNNPSEEEKTASRSLSMIVESFVISSGK